ncbi:methyltransferase domain-containing protein, partial [Candidatus Gottesmanbacteria bacterium]|nr:methyltransferase domain-containing protein [Candidatus Gottesmanbacteria bacterium]
MYRNLVSCANKFKSSKIKSLEINDISKEKIPFKNKFDFISAIRILKYIPNWKEVIDKISKQLSHEGICVFSVLNNYSVNRLLKSENPISRSSVS